MKSFSKKKKILTGVAAIAVSAVAVCGFIGMSAANAASGNEIPQFTHTIRTAVGEAPQLGTGTTYYVAPAAKGTGDGSSAENAAEWYNLINAPEGVASKIKKGDTVLFEEGVYTSFSTMYVSAQGAYNDYVTFKPATEGAQVILDFSTQAFGPRGVHISGNYIYWYDIDVCGAGDNGILLTGSYCTIEGCEFYNNRDTGLQIAREKSDYTNITQWPNYDLILNCTSHNNYDNETKGENADGFASKLTVGYGIVFDGCIAYRNSDDGWDLFAKSDSGNIGTVVLYNCIAFENGFMEYTQAENNARLNFNTEFAEKDTSKYTTEYGDGNGFKLGGSVLDGDVVLYNCLSFNNRMHGFTDNSNPGSIFLQNITSYDNGVAVDETTGKIVYGGSDAEGHNNIDMSRQSYSYNMLDGALSAKSGMVGGDNNYLGKDVIRGSVRNSILGSNSGGDKSYKYTTALDVDTKEGLNTGEEIDAIGTSAFKEVSVVMGGDTSARTYTYNIDVKDDLGTVKSGADLKGVASIELNANRVHLKYRNSDGSIKFGDLFALQNADLLGNGASIGADFNKTAYDQYKHFTAGVIADPTDEVDYILKRAKETLTIATDASNVYQDFDVPANIDQCDVTWVSDKPEVVKVPDEAGEPSLSGVRYYRLLVYRQQADTSVKITAIITYGSGAGARSIEKEFNLKVMAAQFRIGDIVAVPEGEGATPISADGRIIIDLYSVFREPQIVVYDGSDYNGKTLDPDLYNVTTKYEYQNEGGNKVVVHDFTPSNAGIFTITKSVALKTAPTDVKTMTYRIYVASTAAKVAFEGNATISLNTTGYAIAGNFSNPTGIIYAVSSTERLKNSANPVTKENIQTYTGVESHSFRNESGKFDFTNANAGEYYIYYALGNLNGEVTTDIKEEHIVTKNINTAANFIKVANGESLGGETVAHTIYVLTKDLSLNSTANIHNIGTFKGLINGCGHTISNVKIDSTDKTIWSSDDKSVGLFAKVDGGTLMNIKFENISIKSDMTKTGLVGEAKSGYFHNIVIKNIDIRNTNERNGALIGQMSGGSLYISQIAVVNDADHKILRTQPNYTTPVATDKGRIGGIIGFIQPGSTSPDDIYIDISDCDLDFYGEAGEQIGGVIGCYDGNKGGCSMVLNITSCVFRGTLRADRISARRVGGIVGYQSNSNGAVLRVRNCFSIGKIYLDSVENNPNEQVTISDKNCSGIFGGYDASADTIVENCVALMEEFNEMYVVRSYGLSTIGRATIFNIRLDTTNKWTLHYAEGSSTELDAPFVSLNFLGNWQ